MKESLQIILLSGSLITGVLSVMLSLRLARKYNLPYLSSYFYYLIFLFVFGVYGIIGSHLIRVFLENQGMDQEALESVCMFITFLGIPFLVLSWYMFIRTSREIVNRGFVPAFNLLFPGLLSILYLSLGLLLVRSELLGENRFELISALMFWAYASLTLLIYGYSLVQLFIHAREFLDGKDRFNIRLFGYFYLFFCLGTVLLPFFGRSGILPGLAFVTLLFALHLLPLFFLSMYLDKNFVEPVARQEFERNLAYFAERFEISRREAEVVELICKGKSNQDISDCLFISLQTVKDHIHRIFLKTGVKNRVQLTNLIRSIE